MATVYRASVCGSNWAGWRLSYEVGETLLMEGTPMVQNLLTGTYYKHDDSWHYIKEDAARACIPELRKNRDEIDNLILETMRGTTGQPGPQRLHSSAVG